MKSMVAFTIAVALLLVICLPIACDHGDRATGRPAMYPNLVYYVFDDDNGLCFAVIAAGGSHNSGVGMTEVDCGKIRREDGGFGN